MIVPATIEAVSYVAANMSEADRVEMRCQYEEGLDVAAVRGAAIGSTEAYVAMVGDDPAVAFGCQRIAASVMLAWSFGTDQAKRAMPEVTAFVISRFDGFFGSEGITRVEARSIASNEKAHRWMLGLGASPVPCLSWGRGGEDFVLFAWTRADWARYRGWETHA